jgi:HSP20 family molecular chaperone IbpA
VVVGMTAEKFRGRAQAAVAVSAKGACTSPKAQAGAKSPSTVSSEWNPWQEIRNVQMQMDQLFDGMVGRTNPAQNAALAAPNPGYALSLNLQDLKDRYEVHAFLPNTKTSNANVSLQGNRKLKVAVTNEDEQTSKGSAVANVTEWGLYEQTVALPSPVKVDQMKIERKDHELVITLPKVTG